jgi:tripartite-type tricarboxylate transporter receptor subunit TctC
MNQLLFLTTCRRFLAFGGLVLVALAGPAAAQTQAYPSKPVRIIVGFPPGTGPDIVARLLAQNLSQAWNNQAVVVDNKPGAGGVIAAAEAARAMPDGYTLMLGETGQLSIAPNSYNRLPYDAKRDFIPVSQVVTSDFTLLLNPLKVPARDVKQFVAWAGQQKNGLFMGSFGAGTPGHFGTYVFGEAIGLKAEAVHYKNTGDALTGIMNGDVAAAFSSVALSMPQVRGGKMIAIGSTGPRRSVSLPDVPTFAEQGYPKVRFSSWYGIVAPTGTPPDIVAKLEADVRRAMLSEDGKAKMEAAGFGVTATTAAEFARILAADTITWGKAVAGFKAD